MSVPTPGGSPTLLLVPTNVEREGLAALGGFEPGVALEEDCGFGPIAAAARTASLLARMRPARVLLLGIAGSYDVASFPVGSAARIQRVEIDGLETAGFEQAPGIGASLDLATSPLPVRGEARATVLVTVLSPSASIRQAEERLERHPEATAEDMEGYGVAVACAIERVPLAIVRGIANAAGDRNRNGWKIREALAAARVLAIELLGQREWAPPR
jgi:futalosine hydrolase